MELNELLSFKRLNELDNKLSSQVESVYKLIKETINAIPGCYNNYTMHDMSHGLRVAMYMEELAFGIDDKRQERIESFNAFELSLLLLSAIMHDIGMFIRPEDKEKIKNNDIKYTNALTFHGILKVVNNNEEEAIKEIVRLTHAYRIKEYLEFDFGGKTIASILMLNDNYPYANDVAEICIGHGENYDYIKKLRDDCTKGNYQYNPRYLSVLLRIADYLDLDKQRTPILWYRIMRVEGFSKSEWERHFIIHNEKKLKEYGKDKMQIFFEGNSSNANIHRKYLRFIDDLKLELENADMVLNTINTKEKYHLNVTTKIDDRVLTEGFKYSDLRLNLDYKSITELLMGKNIYGDNKLGLRELVQNALDSCKIMKEINETGIDTIIEPQVSIIISKQNGFVKIKDTGIGMTLDVVKKHFLNIGKSYYKSNEFLYKDLNYKPIGQYGIGFLACFLLSDSVCVKTKYYKNNEINNIELEKSSEYVVTNTEETGTFLGTEIILEYKKFSKAFPTIASVKEFLELYFYTDIPISIRNDDEKDTIRISNSCNSIINNHIEKDLRNTNIKVEQIECAKYSEVLEGSLKIYKKKNKRKSFDTNTVSDVFYLFDADQSVFMGNPIIPHGYYRLMEYYIVDPEDYKRISSSRKNNRKKRIEMKALAKETKYLLISEKDQLSYYSSEESEELVLRINDQSFQSILEKSGFPLYSKDYVDDDFEFDLIFVSDNQFVYLDSFVLINNRYFNVISEDCGCSDFYFYNKGVYIPNARRIRCWIPCSKNGLGVINYKGDRIKLDVSRKNIIKNTHIIELELSNIILQHLMESSKNESFNKMVFNMIQYNNIEKEKSNE